MQKFLATYPIVRTSHSGEKQHYCSANAPVTELEGQPGQRETKRWQAAMVQKMNRPRGRNSASLRSVHKTLLFAVANKRLIRIAYHGVLRIGEPHDYGVKRGITKLLFYQLQTMSDSHPWKTEAGWRMLEVAKIEDCILSSKVFPGSRGSSHRRHLVWDELFARVD